MFDALRGRAGLISSDRAGLVLALEARASVSNLMEKLREPVKGLR